MASQLIELYRHFYKTDELTPKNLTDLAGRLSKVIHRKEPWQYRYLISVIRNYKNVTASNELKKAIAILATQLDEQSSLIATIQGPYSVYSSNGLRDNVIILGKPRYCARPSCNVEFVPNVPNKKYCCSEHKRLFYNEKRRLKNE